MIYRKELCHYDPVLEKKKKVINRKKTGYKCEGREKSAFRKPAMAEIVVIAKSIAKVSDDMGRWYKSQNSGTLRSITLFFLIVQFDFFNIFIQVEQKKLNKNFADTFLNPKISTQFAGTL